MTGRKRVRGVIYIRIGVPSLKVVTVRATGRVV